MEIEINNKILKPKLGLISKLTKYLSACSDKMVVNFFPLAQTACDPLASYQ